MIDIENRNRIAELIGSLSSGLISNDEFEGALPESDDSAISEIFFHGAWYLCSLVAYRKSSEFSGVF